MNVKALVAHLCLTLQPHEAVLSMEFSRQDTGVGGHSFARGSSRPRDRNWVSCIAGRFFFFVCLFFLQADSLPSESPGNLKLFKIEFTFSLSVALQRCLL